MQPLHLSARARLARAAWLGLACGAGLACCVDQGFAQTSANEAEVKAAFVFNFLKFVDWPTQALTRPDESLTIAIVGEGAVADAAAKFLQGKRVGSHPLAVRRMKVGEPLSSIHAVFVTGAEAHQPHPILTTAGNASVLTIGDDEHFAARGGVIAVFVHDRKVRFEVNTDAADARALRVSSRLLSLARLVRAGASGKEGRP